ncbi:MAG: hypothetical protein K8R74_00385 [Bacteroidales bacterium]|nr:hypothetical protein [Bacteroidales bacterium]
MKQLDDWRGKGFAEPPKLHIAVGNEIIYRAFGGYKSIIIGRWFAPFKCSSVSETELKYNITLQGNKLAYIASYRVRPDVEMWVGRVAHDARDLADRTAVQIYIEEPLLDKIVLVRDVESLKQDLFVSRHTGNV